MRRQAMAVAGILGLALLAGSRPAWVHHSGAMFDRSRTVVINGVVKDFQWTNPHSSFSVDVLDATGTVATWWIEMNGPANLIREGWKRSTIKPGDKVTVTVNPLRDGRPGGWYLGIKLPDGKALTSSDAPAGG